MKHSQVLIPPNFLMPADEFKKSDNPWRAFVEAPFEPNHPLKEEVVGMLLESYLRDMLTACAAKLCMPAYSDQFWASPKRLRKLLPPSLSKRIDFVDRGGGLWDNICAYFKPMCDDMPPFEQREGEDMPGYYAYLVEIAWCFYLLVAATRRGSEAVFNPVALAKITGHLVDTNIWSGESRTRLGLLAGVFGLFKVNEELPCFMCTLPPGESLRSRMEELLEDAYLLEASGLRRFFSVSSNKASVRRDLRRLLDFIAKNRSWAKNAVVVTSQMSSIAPSIGQVGGLFGKFLPNLGGDTSACLLLDDLRTDFSQRMWRVEGHMDVTKGRDSWFIKMIRTYKTPMQAAIDALSDLSEECT